MNANAAPQVVFAGLDTDVEIVPAGHLTVGSGTRGGFSTHYDVVCPRCGPVESNVMYLTATAARADHLCRPRTRRG